MMMKTYDDAVGYWFDDSNGDVNSKNDETKRIGGEDDDDDDSDDGGGSSDDNDNSGNSNIGTYW